MMEKKLLLRATRLGPRSDSAGLWEANKNKDWDARVMAVHAAMVDRMDQGVGKIVARLTEKKLLDNTLILFLSDNGASPEVYPTPGFDRPSQTRDGRKIAYPPQKNVMPGTEETFSYLGPSWASVCNTPLKYWKAEMHEGGICTPAIVHWPTGLKTAAAAITYRPVHVIDVMATCVELAGATYPQEFHGHKITPMEGASFAREFRREPFPAHEVMAWEHFGARAIREPSWKLVARKGGPWELYKVFGDRGETEDLAAKEPAKVRELAEKWEAWAKRTNVYPAPP
jgi:arylsulfatase